MLEAAFKVLLWRYSGQRDVVVGTPIAGRNRLETEGLIGFFINTLVLRTKIEEGWSFRELIKKEREVTLGAYSHQDVPFERVVEEMQPERDLSRTPLFQVLFEMENVPKQEGRLSGLKVSGTSLVANATHTRAARMAQSVLSRAGSPPAIAAIGPRPFLESPPPAASP